jgi:hypothetical protein
VSRPMRGTPRPATPHPSDHRDRCNPGSYPHHTSVTNPAQKGAKGDVGDLEFQPDRRVSLTKCVLSDTSEGAAFPRWSEIIRLDKA